MPVKPTNGSWVSSLSFNLQQLAEELRTCITALVVCQAITKLKHAHNDYILTDLLPHYRVPENWCEKPITNK